MGLTALYGFWQRWLSPFECASFGKTWKEQDAEEMLMARIKERQEARRAMFDRRLAAQQRELALAELREAREREREVWA